MRTSTIAIVLAAAAAPALSVPSLSFAKRSNIARDDVAARLLARQGAIAAPKALDPGFVAKLATLFGRDNGQQRRELAARQGAISEGPVLSPATVEMLEKAFFPGLYGRDNNRRRRELVARQGAVAAPQALDPGFAAKLAALFDQQRKRELTARSLNELD